MAEIAKRSAKRRRKEVARMRVHFHLQGHTDTVVSLVAHPHLPILVSGSCDGTVRVWDLEARTTLRTLAGHGGSVFGLALDPTGRRLALAGKDDRTVKLWNLETDACLRTIEDPSMGDVRAVVWDWSGTLVALGSGNGSVCVWDAASGAPRHTLKGHSHWVFALAAHPTDDLLASGSANHTVRVWRWSSGDCVRTLNGHEGEVSSLTASAAWLVSGSYDKTVRVWSWTSEECVHVLDSFVCEPYWNSLSMRDSTLVTIEWTGIDGTVRVWDASSADPRTWSCVGSLAPGASSGCGVAVVGGGRVACAAPGISKTIALWRA